MRYEVLGGRSDFAGISNPYVCKITLLNGAGRFILLLLPAIALKPFGFLHEFIHIKFYLFCKGLLQVGYIVRSI